jgi:hypothetical protein
MQNVNVYEFTVNLLSKQAMGEHLGHHVKVVAADPQTAMTLVQTQYGSDLTGIKVGPVEIVHNAISA